MTVLILLIALIAIIAGTIHFLARSNDDIDAQENAIVEQIEDTAEAIGNVVEDTAEVVVTAVKKRTRRKLPEDTINPEV